MSRMDAWTKLIIDNQNAEYSLPRTPEPEPVTNQENSVKEYNKVLNTNMVANYTMGLDLIYRSRKNENPKTALDICSGPGFFSTFLHQELNYQHVHGIDLSLPMVEIANKNISEKNLSNNISFSQGNACDLSQFENDSFDLVTFTNSAHHLENLDDVSAVLSESDRVAKKNGLILLTDICRLKNRDVTDRFVELAGEEFLALDMPHMFNDFKNSMDAAWTASELRTSIPQGSQRLWIQMIPTTLTSLQAIIGIPEDQAQLFLRETKNWENSHFLKSENAKQDWRVVKSILDTASFQTVETNTSSIGVA